MVKKRIFIQKKSTIEIKREKKLSKLLLIRKLASITVIHQTRTAARRGGGLSDIENINVVDINKAVERVPQVNHLRCGGVFFKIKNVLCW